MTPAELRTLKYFDDTERRLDGALVDWIVADYRTFWWIDDMRRRLHSPIYIIRETHPNRPGAVDGCCPGLSLAHVYMAGLSRIPSASFGLYSGGSWHIDFREDYGTEERWPARWLAIKPTEVAQLTARGLAVLIQPQAEGIEKDGWVYLVWDHARSFEGLQFVCDLAEQRVRKGGRTDHA